MTAVDLTNQLSVFFCTKLQFTNKNFDILCFRGYNAIKWIEKRSEFVFLKIFPFRDASYYSIGNDAVYEYSTDTAVEVTDIMGKKIVVNPIDGKVKININGNVQYITK